MSNTPVFDRLCLELFTAQLADETLVACVLEGWSRSTAHNGSRPRY